MNSKKILVIGSNSFSGSHFVAEALRGGHQVWATSRSRELDPVFLPYLWLDPARGEPLANQANFSFQAIDLNSQLSQLLELVDRVQPSHVVNFAAQGMVAESWFNPTHWYRTNVVSQVALHDALRQRPFLEKYLHVTTPEVYGSTDGGWIREHNQFAPSTPYAVSRAACDLHLHSFQKAYGFPVVFTRAANVYGPGQQLYRIIPRALLSARTGKPMQLHGGGYSERCFIHISDVVRATLQLALEAEPGSTWHLSTQEPISIRDLVERICQRCGVAFDSVVEESGERLGKDQSYLLDSTAIREKFGWSDQVRLDEGFSETLAWVDSHLDQLQTLPWTYQHKV
ncbi:NAD(P)-dependent oxidoreductase [Cyanobium sp. WAJ14-Wanaka]|uniref:NAD-dependent epimerase/dehydratase family protein n=1 Tax=Cyanobium sp. WAJ14-Wanaka TaxID=2823725 RepID=UPI0020CF2584|nr:GDP-mannose 4,6-dehydratase [Cyanobium sp. WAJ14-Wanaka]MCP9775665.1 GDP-mannose 4,6-dehydratase [Cyanobium sp. WAJ14-Wanaka]